VQELGLVVELPPGLEEGEGVLGQLELPGEGRLSLARELELIAVAAFANLQRSPP